MKEVYIINMADGWGDAWVDHVFCITETFEQAVEIINDTIERIQANAKKYGISYTKTVYDHGWCVQLLENKEAMDFYEFSIMRYDIGKTLVSFPGES